MANTSRKFGLRPVANLQGSPWTGKVNPYVKGAADATVIGVGSMVQLDGGGDTTTGLPTVTLHQPSGDDATLPVGVVVGVDFNPLDLNLSGSYAASSVRRILYVVDDPTALFEVQATGALAIASLGLNAKGTASSVSTTTGREQFELDSATAAASASYLFKILAFKRAEDNEISATYAKVIVKLNRHQYANAMAGI